MTTFLHTPGPWRPGKRNRRYGMTAGIYAGEGKDRIELGRMYIGSPMYEANFSLVLASPLMAHTLDIAPSPRNYGQMDMDLFFRAYSVWEAARLETLSIATTLHRSA